MDTPAKTGDAVQILSELLTKVNPVPSTALFSSEWRPRRALICHPDPSVRTRLVEHFSTAREFEVYAADRLEPALNMLREGRINIIVFDSYFDPDQRGTEVLRRYIEQLKPKSRRQLYVVLLAPNYRTLDPNAAFLEAVNAVVSSDELTTLRPALERSLREYNLLYKTFNQVTGNQPL